jgi:hypothetical protein
MDAEVGERVLVPAESVVVGKERGRGWGAHGGVEGRALWPRRQDLSHCVGTPAQCLTINHGKMRAVELCCQSPSAVVCRPHRFDMRGRSGGNRWGVFFEGDARGLLLSRYRRNAGGSSAGVLRADSGSSNGGSGRDSEKSVSSSVGCGQWFVQ